MEYVGYGVYGVWGIWGTGDMGYGVKYRVMWWWAYIFNTRKWKIRNKMLGGRKSRGMGYGVWDVWGMVYGVNGVYGVWVVYGVWGVYGV